MDNQRVKKKLALSTALALPAVFTFLASYANVFPPQVVENAYARSAFPMISRASAVAANAVPFSWLDVWILFAGGLLAYGLYRRRWRMLVGAVSFFYLWFFWGWGLNYHRPPLASRLHLDMRTVSKADVDRFTATAAREINRLWPVASRAPLDRTTVAAMASDRVEAVVRKVDGTDWPATTRVKRSFLAEPWYRIAGIDGMFNPFGQEPLVIQGPLPFELPFLMSHELAHVRGVANEGEANLIALLATAASSNPRFQYSGWLYIWGYLPNASDTRLNAGPRADLRAVRDRIRAHRIKVVSNFQATVLDTHLRLNAVPGGIQSYSDFVALAIVSQSRWRDFR